MTLNLLQWNTRSILNKKHDLIYLLNKFKPVAFAISETWLRPGTTFRVPGYSCLRDDRADGWAGSALLVTKSTTFSQIPIPSHSPEFQIVAVKTFGITLVSIYIPHPNQSILSELQSLLSTLCPPFIIMGDFNCHHTLWGSQSTDTVSTYLLDLLDDIDLCVLNDGSSTRRVSPLQNPSCPDLTLASPTLVTKLTWQVLP